MFSFFKQSKYKKHPSISIARNALFGGVIEMEIPAPPSGYVSEIPYVVPSGPTQVSEQRHKGLGKMFKQLKLPQKLIFGFVD